MYKIFIIVCLSLFLISCENDEITSPENEEQCEFTHSNKFDSLSILMDGNWNLSLIQIHKNNELIAAIENFECNNIPFNLEKEIYTKINIDKKFKLNKIDCYNNTDKVYWELTWLQTPNELFGILFNINEYNVDCVFKQKIIIKPSSKDLRLNYSIDDYYVDLLYLKN